MEEFATRARYVICEIGGDGEEAKEKAADCAGENCCCDGAVGGILWDEPDLGHLALPMS